MGGHDLVQCDQEQRNPMGRGGSIMSKNSAGEGDDSCRDQQEGIKKSASSLGLRKGV